MKKLNKDKSTFDRDIHNESKLIRFAHQRNNPLFEVENCGCTLELTPNKNVALEAFNTAQSATLWEVHNGHKRMLNCKSYHKNAIETVLNSINP